MEVVLLRVGIDSAFGGIQGPLFQDTSFEFVPIPDRCGVNSKTYANTPATKEKGKSLIEYFARKPRLQAKRAGMPIHDDPEFDTFTYGDQTTPKRGLKNLEKDDLLLFYAGLEGWGFRSDPALYIIGYFVVEEAGIAEDLISRLGPHRFDEMFANNFHVRHRRLFEAQKDILVLVKGSPESRLLTKAVLISSPDPTRRGLKVLSEPMREYFGDLGGKTSIQRSPPRRVEPEFVEKAANYVRKLR
jgi:hypothetical protein